MLCISKKAEYALIALAHLAEWPGRVASAREIAGARELPVAMLMNILKNLQGHGLLRSTRGVKGGYAVACDLSRVSLHELIAVVDCDGHGGTDGDCGCLDHVQDVGSGLGFGRTIEAHGPVQALQFRLLKFLRDVTVADLVMPGRRIDVPVELLKVNRSKEQVNLCPSH
jgi:Rrf2 family protein